MKKIIFAALLCLIFSLFVSCENANVSSDIEEIVSSITQNQDSVSDEESTIESETEEVSSEENTSSAVSSVDSSVSSVNSRTEESNTSSVNSKNTSSKASESNTTTVSTKLPSEDKKSSVVSETKSTNISKPLTNDSSKNTQEIYKEAKPNNESKYPESSAANNTKNPTSSKNSSNSNHPGEMPSEVNQSAQGNNNQNIEVIITPPIQPEKPFVPTIETEDVPNNETAVHKGYMDKADYGYTYTKNQKHNWLSLEEKYCYSLLNDREKEIYKKVNEAVENLESTIEIGSGFTAKQIDTILKYYENDNPENFYFQYSGITIYQRNDDFSVVVHYNFGEMKEFPEDFEGLNQEQTQKLKDRIAKFNIAVENIVSTIPADAPDVVKEILIYDRLLIDSKYNLPVIDDVASAHQDNFTPYGVLVNKTGVCESYSEAFQLLCNAVGINCTTKYSDNHQWNIVKLDSEWYECDITFDDPINIEDGIVYGHTYFNRTTDFISQTHTETQAYNTPVCTATKYDFLKYFHNK